MKNKEIKNLICRLMAAIETPDDLTEEDIKDLLLDAHIYVTSE